MYFFEREPKTPRRSTVDDTDRPSGDGDNRNHPSTLDTADQRSRRGDDTDKNNLQKGRSYHLHLHVHLDLWYVLLIPIIFFLHFAEHLPTLAQLMRDL